MCTTSVSTYGAFGRNSTHAPTPSIHQTPMRCGRRKSASASTAGIAARYRFHTMNGRIGPNACTAPAYERGGTVGSRQVRRSRACSAGRCVRRGLGAHDIDQVSERDVHVVDVEAPRRSEQLAQHETVIGLSAL